jgi:hypothetical protein
MLKRITLKQAGLIYISMNIVTIIVHLSVIFGLMPYTWINGGRSATYEIARQTSINSIPYFVIGLPIILIACEIIRVRWNSIVKKTFFILLWIVVAYTCLGLIMQLLGTPFEKSVMSVVCAVSIIMGIRLAIEKH